MSDLDFEAAPTRLKFAIPADVPSAHAQEVVTLVILEAHSRRVASIRLKLPDKYWQQLINRTIVVTHVRKSLMMREIARGGYGISARGRIAGGASLQSRDRRG
jgi:hypothetical protein